MGFEDFGEVITDPYRELHPEDSEKWLRLLDVARLCSYSRGRINWLMFLRCWRGRRLVFWFSELL